jgi:hypothetical protein
MLFGKEKDNRDSKELGVSREGMKAYGVNWL